MLKKSRLIALSVIVILLAGCSARQTIKELPEQKIKLGRGELTVELAISPLEQSKGLSGRDNLPNDKGMLFVFDRPGNYTFWMEEMNFPIDIIWLRNGEVIGIDDNVLPPIKPDARVQTVIPPAEVDRVLETSANWAKDNQVKIGSRIEYLR